MLLAGTAPVETRPAGCHESISILAQRVQSPVNASMALFPLTSVASDMMWETPIVSFAGRNIRYSD